MKRSMIPLAAAALATIPAAAHAAASKPKATPTATAKPVPTKKYKGPIVDTRWGPVQVTVYIKGKKITNVKAAVAPDTDRSLFIDQQSIPMLHDEVLQTQSAKIDVISGATYTSEGFILSLQRALKTAHYKAPKA